MEVRWAAYDADALADERTFAQALEALPWEERRRRALAFHFARDRRLSVAAGLLAAHLLCQAGARDLTLVLGPQGKPHLASHPDLHFNLSHSGHIVTCAVATRAVGVDGECAHPFDEGIARLCFTEQEMDWLHTQQDASCAFVRLWCRKESYLKLLGTGLSKDALSFEAMPGALPEKSVRFAEAERCGHAICVCTRSVEPVEFAEAPSRFWMA